MQSLANHKVSFMCFQVRTFRSAKQKTTVYFLLKTFFVKTLSSASPMTSFFFMIKMAYSIFTAEPVLQLHFSLFVRGLNILIRTAGGLVDGVIRQLSSLLHSVFCVLPG